MRHILAAVSSILFCLPVAAQSPDLVEARAQMGAAAAARDKTPNLRLRGSGNDEFWRTVIIVKGGDRWLEAAEITTPITGAAK